MNNINETNNSLKQQFNSAPHRQQDHFPVGKYKNSSGDDGND